MGHPIITGSGMGGDALLKQFTVTNYSSKPVQSIEYGWRISAPVACPNSTLPVRWETASANVNIAPGAEAVIDALGQLSAPGTSKKLAELADTDKTPVVLVTIGIVKVTFADAQRGQMMIREARGLSFADSERTAEEEKPRVTAPTHHRTFNRSWRRLVGIYQ